MKNEIIPTHKKLDEKDVNSLIEKYGLTGVKQLPKIKMNDKAISDLDLSLNDVIEIVRENISGEDLKYYRVVIA